MVELSDQVDAFRQQTAKHLLHLGDQRVQIERFGLDRLFPAECQELLGQFSGAPAGSADLLDSPPDIA